MGLQEKTVLMWGQKNKGKKGILEKRDDRSKGLEKKIWGQVFKMIRRGYGFYRGSLGCRQRKACEEVITVGTLQLQVKEKKRKKLLIYITEKPRVLASGPLDPGPDVLLWRPCLSLHLGFDFFIVDFTLREPLTSWRQRQLLVSPESITQTTLLKEKKRFSNPPMALSWPCSFPGI